MRSADNGVNAGAMARAERVYLRMTIVTCARELDDGAGAECVQEYAQNFRCVSRLRHRHHAFYERRALRIMKEEKAIALQGRASMENRSSQSTS